MIPHGESQAITPWLCITIISVAGFVGGLVNALMSEEGFVIPKRYKGILCPGFFGNGLIGALAAFVSWGLYGSGSGVDLAKRAAEGDARVEVSLTIGAIAGAILVGIGGARWLSNEVDKKFLRATASGAAEREIPVQDCNMIRKTSPRKALAIVEKYPSPSTQA